MRVLGFLYLLESILPGYRGGSPLTSPNAEFQPKQAIDYFSLQDGPVFNATAEFKKHWSCEKKPDINRIYDEIRKTIAIVSDVSQNMIGKAGHYQYARDLLPATLSEQFIKTYLSRMSIVAEGSEKLPLEIQCVGGGACGAKGSPTLAWTGNGYEDNPKALVQIKLNLCPPLFENAAKYPFDVDVKCEKGKGLQKYESKVRVFAHEFAHLDTGGAGPKLDNYLPADDLVVKDPTVKGGEADAYGVNYATGLVQGKYPVVTDLKTDFAKKNPAAFNAENWGYLVSAQYYNQKCKAELGGDIPLFDAPPKMVAQELRA